MAKNSKLEALLAAGQSGATAGFMDEIDGLSGAAQASILDGSTDGFWDTYKKERDVSRGRRDALSEQHPRIDFAGEALGTGLGVLATAPIAVPMRLGKAALAAGGALEGLGRSDQGDALGMADDAAGGALTALAGGKVLEGLGAAGRVVANTEVGRKVVDGAKNLAAKGASKFQALLDGGPKWADELDVLSADPPPLPLKDLSFVEPMKRQQLVNKADQMAYDLANRPGSKLGKVDPVEDRLAEMNYFRQMNEDLDDLGNVETARRGVAEAERLMQERYGGKMVENNRAVVNPTPEKLAQIEAEEAAIRQSASQKDQALKVLEELKKKQRPGDNDFFQERRAGPNEGTR